MIKRLFYVLVPLFAYLWPPWWSGLIVGIGLVIGAADFGTWLATRQHRRETRERVEDEGREEL